MVIKEKKGITLTTLVITIAVLIIVAAISISSGSESIGDIRLKSFYVRLELIQKRVDEVQSKNEKYIDENGVEVIITKQGMPYQEFSLEQKNILKEAFLNLETEEYLSKFRIFSVEDLEKYLDLTDIGFDVFINFEDKRVVAIDGLKVNEKTYYMLEETEYYIDSSESSVNSEIQNPEIIFDAPTSQESKYNVSISVILGANYISIYELKYKETSLENWNKYLEDSTFNCWNKYWKQIENDMMIMEKDKIYKVVCIDTKGNKTEKNIKLSQDENLNVVIEDVVE